jgi:hypothetical protein
MDKQTLLQWLHGLHSSTSIVFLDFVEDEPRFRQVEPALGKTPHSTFALMLNAHWDTGIDRSNLVYNNRGLVETRIVTVEAQRLLWLEERSEKLSALLQAGVDNWEGYESAMDTLAGWKEV